MTAANLDHANLDAMLRGGGVKEDVLDQIFLLDNYDTPFTGMCSSGTHGNKFTEFVTDALGTPATDNALVDGQEIDQNDTVLGHRVGNYTQIAGKSFQISHQAQASNSIGKIGGSSYQLMRGLQRLRRDVEAQMLTGQASVAGDSLTVPGISAGLGAWIETNTIGGVGFSAGGFNDSTGLIDAPTPGTAAALSYAGLKDLIQAVFDAGGEGKYIMATSNVIRKISEFMFTDNAYVANMVNDKGTDAGMTAYGASMRLVTEFGNLDLIPNRLLQPFAADTSRLYILDPKYLKQSFLRGYRTEPLAKTGLSNKHLISCDYSLCVLNDESQACYHDIDETADMVA